jgi:hypothetical protein
MMERLGAPQTHLGLKTMIKEVDEDGDGAISFRYSAYLPGDQEHDQGGGRGRRRSHLLQV